MTKDSIIHFVLKFVLTIYVYLSWVLIVGAFGSSSGWAAGIFAVAILLVATRGLQIRNKRKNGRY